MKHNETIKQEFQSFNNCGKKHIKILGKNKVVPVPVPRISQEASENFYNVEAGQMKVIWSDQDISLGVTGLNQSVGYACQLNWENLSLGIVGHIDSWTQESAQVTLPTLEKWVTNLMQVKGVSPHSVIDGKTWLIKSIRERTCSQKNISFLNKLQNDLSKFNPVWAPPESHTRFVCQQAATGFLFNLNPIKNRDEPLSFLWIEDEKRIYINNDPMETFLLNYRPNQNFIKRWASSMQKNLFGPHKKQDT